MGYYDFKGQAAAQRAYDNACDCCDHGPREASPEPMEREPERDLAREWAGAESQADALEFSLSENRRLARIFGDDWHGGLFA